MCSVRVCVTMCGKYVYICVWGVCVTVCVCVCVVCVSVHGML